MGGRGGSSGLSVRNNSNTQTKPIEGVKGSVFSSWNDVSRSSNNDIWTDGSVHAVLKNDKGTAQVKGDKKDRFALLNSVNTAVVHLRGVNPNDYTKREVTRLNRDLQSIKAMGFDTPKIYASFDETIVFAKRKLFTKNF